MSHCYRTHRTIQLTRLFWKFLKRYLLVYLSLYGYYIIGAGILHTWSRILKSLSTNYKHVLQSRYLVTYDITIIIVSPCIKISQYALQTTYHLKLAPWTLLSGKRWSVLIIMQYLSRVSIAEYGSKDLLRSPMRSFVLHIYEVKPLKFTNYIQL